MVFNVRDFPRPPRLEQISKHVVIKWSNGDIIADTRRAYWVLETYHPPTYYIPRTDIHTPLTPTARKTYCEWKGVAAYFSLTPPASASTTSPPKPIENRAWTVPAPTPGFEAITDHVAFYVGPWECWVDGEKARPQPGGFYAGWVTDEFTGPIKGAPGTTGW